MKKQNLFFVCGLAFLGVMLFFVQDQKRNDKDQIRPKEFTFDEMVDCIAKECDLDQGEVIAHLVNRKMEILQDQNPGLQIDELKALEVLRTAAYAHSIIPVPSSSSYQPKGIQLYYKTTELGGSPKGMDEICWSALDCTDRKTGIAKQFSGSVYVHRLDSQTVDWMVNGDFFDCAAASEVKYPDTAASKMIPAETGESADTTVEAAFLPNHFAYYNQSGRYYIE